jgi:hypothetical protein
LVDNNRDFSFNNAGSFSNITTSQTSQIDGMSLASYSYYGDVYESISLNSPGYVTGWNNTIKYVSGVDNYIIDTPFSNFNPGVYTGYFSGSPFFVGALNTVTVASVPEPSTYALLGIGALALVVAYLRKVA